MGNWCGKIMNKAGVHPVDGDGDGGHRERTTVIATRRTSVTSVRIKVRMTKKQLMDLAAQVDMRKDTTNYNSELGRLILQQCLEGQLISASSPVVAANHGRSSKTPKGQSILSTIHEE